MSDAPEKKRKNAMPWDLLSPNTVYVPEEVYSERYETCKSCEHFNKITRMCKQCHCFMKIKCAIDYAFCPVGKWDYYDMSNHEPDPEWKQTSWEDILEQKTRKSSQ
jgi:hypothetical protein